MKPAGQKRRAISAAMGAGGNKKPPFTPPRPASRNPRNAQPGKYAPARNKTGSTAAPAKKAGVALKSTGGPKPAGAITNIAKPAKAFKATKKTALANAGIAAKAAAQQAAKAAKVGAQKAKKK
jgi:hypothetical protein